MAISYGKNIYEVINMNKSNFKENLESNKYFQSLPSYVQETIKQSGITIDSEEELRRCAEKLMKEN